MFSNEDLRKFFKIMMENMYTDNNYSEQCSGSTRAYKVVIPSCISVEEDDEYTDDCYPNPDYEFIESIWEEMRRGDK